MNVTMSGRNALVTGASKGIGFAIAKRFVESGANVAIVARRQEMLDAAAAELAKAGNGKVIPISSDVSTADGCATAHTQAAAGLGPIDVLVNNAGTSQRAPSLEISDEMWQADLDLKLFAAIRLVRLTMPGMMERRWGRIINILNTGAKAPPAGGGPTAVSRAAGLAFTKVLAGEGAPHNVLVNGLLVGRIESEQWERRYAATDGSKTMDEYYAEQGKGLPMRRFGTAEEFANVACLLASEQGSYVTGTAINIDGGLCPVV